MRYFIIFILLLVLIHQKTTDRAKMRKMDSEIMSLRRERPDLWEQSCLRAVNGACYYADCAVVSIEEMQQKICKPLEEE